MSAYGFNEDKSKTALVKMLEITPNDGETYGQFRLRVWGILNSFPMGHIMSILFKLNNTTDEFKSLTLPFYRENGSMYWRADLICNDSSVGYSGVTFYIFNFADIEDDLSNYFLRNVYIRPTEVTEATSREKNQIINNIDAGMKMRIFYIP